MPLELLLKGKQSISLETYEELPLMPDEVRARGLLSAISHGTELSLYLGSSPFHDKRFDTERRLFVAVDDHATYPARLGYEWVGLVEEIGSNVEGYQKGDLVHLPLPHRQTQTYKPAEFSRLGVTGPLPDGLAPEEACFLASTSIALQAIHDAHIKIGDHVAVFGLGVLGLLSVQLARLSGATRIDGIDPIAGRRHLAQQLGATRLINSREIDVGLAMREDGPGADVAIEFSGSYEALHQAIRSVRMGGSVVAAGFYQGGCEELRLGEEWLHNRISMVASSRGWGNTHRDFPRWDRARLRATSISLLRSGQLEVTSFISHRIPFTKVSNAYELIEDGTSNPLKILLIYE